MEPHADVHVQRRLACLRKLHLHGPWITLHRVERSRVEAEGYPKLGRHGKSDRSPGKANLSVAEDPGSRSNQELVFFPVVRQSKNKYL